MRAFREVIPIERGPLTIAVDEERHVVYIGYGPPPQEWFKPWSVILAGPLAETLYIALTGHKYNDPGHDPSINRATFARDMILNGKMVGGISAEQFGIVPTHLAKEVLYNTDLEFVYPGLGQTQLDDQGRILDTALEPVPLPEFSI